MKIENFWIFVRSLNSKWGSEFHGKYDKPVAYVILLTLAFFAILDRAIDWENYANLSEGDFRYGLATGAVQPSDRGGLLAFALIGLLACAVELLNSLTLLCCQGHVLIPVEVEQGVILLLEQIPQAIINLAVTICRNNFVTSLQEWQCFWGLFNTSLRLYAYGYLKERLFPVERAGLATTRRIATYVTTTFLWLFLAFSNVFLWHHARLGHFQFHQPASALTQLDGVSIALERTATHTTHPLNITHAYQMLRAGPSIAQTPWLLHDIGHVAKAPNKSQSVVYKCHDSMATFEPEPCMDANTDGIKFMFKHVMKKSEFNTLPAGEMQYNHALVSRAADDSETCAQAPSDALNDWRLTFYRFQTEHIPYTSHERLVAQRAWKHVCIIPTLRYNPSIGVC